MSKFYELRYKQGDFGVKKTISVTCLLPWCNNTASKYKGPGSQCCEEHQMLLREYGGPARLDRPYTFNKKTTCDFCGFDPWNHYLIKKINDPLIADRVAWGMLIVDHIHTQRDGGEDHPNNCQTLCLLCNTVKSSVSGDTMPKSLYNSQKKFTDLCKNLKPIYKKLFD